MKKNYLKLIFVVMLLFSFSSFSQDLGASDKIINTTTNSYSSINADTDGDGVDDSVDLDADNDGMLDSYECLVSIQFNTPSLLTATDLDNLLVGEKVVYHDALLYQGTYYDIVLTLTSTSGSVNVDVNTELEVTGFEPPQDEYVTYSFDLVEAGSATPGNPTGIPATLDNLIIELRDLDHGDQEDYTEVFGYNNSSVSLSNITTYFTSNTYLEYGGFENGGGPSGFTLFRMDPTHDGDPTDWSDETDDPSSSHPDFTVYMRFGSFSHIDLLLGVTGTQNTAGLRHTQFGANSMCDEDKDGIENKFDIDSDNDGIPDNVEAQSTTGYISPTGSVDANGVLLVYGSGLTPQDTDGDGTSDFIDYDSDNDGILDILENGSLPNSVGVSDSDGDGLLDVFETNGVNDSTWDINEDIEDPTDLSILSDTDGDLPLGGDLDYRDAVNNYIESASLDFDGIDDHVIGTPIFAQFNESKP